MIINILDVWVRMPDDNDLGFVYAITWSMLRANRMNKEDENAR